MDDKSWLTIAVQCHNFQRRLTWMFSSVLPQARGIVFMIDAMHRNGDPQTEAVEAKFRHIGMTIDFKAWTDMAEFERRGIVRTAQVQRCKTPWILFADSDMVYAPTFFAALKKHIDSEFPGMYTSGRMSQDSHAATDALIEMTKNSIQVEDPFTRACSLDLVGRSCVGAGFFQLVKLESCAGYYVHPVECKDWRWSGKGQKAKSDQQFRHRIGIKQRLPRWFWANQIHLNHARDNQAGCHLEEQR
jgi:hypothetical protein